MSTLPIEAIRNIAATHSYEEIQFNEQSRVIAFRSHLASEAGPNDVRVNVYYTTGTVATCLDHPRSGKTQLFRHDQTLEDLSRLFHDPRAHTGVGYYRRNQRDAWAPATAETARNHNSKRNRCQSFQGTTECDDARRWRYVSAATGFCNHSQANQIAALCRLYDNLRFMPGGQTFKEVFDSLSDEIKQALPPRQFCSDSHDHRNCRCSERAGAWCSLLSVLCCVAHKTERVIGCVKPGAGEEELDAFAIGSVIDCTCKEGREYRVMYGTMLAKLERQLMSLPRNVRRELLVWYIHKQTHGYVPFCFTKEEGPVLLGAAYCSNEILDCHHDYGELMYDAENGKGCNCHGR